MRIEVAVESKVGDGDGGAKKKRVGSQMQREEFEEMIELRT